MQNIYFIITQHKIYSYSPDPNTKVLLKELVRLDDPEINLRDSLTELVKSLRLSSDYKVNFVLDHHFLGYHYFCFPPISSRKVKQVLEFELQNQVIEELDTYFYSHHIKVSKELSRTEIGVYSAGKEIVSQIISACKEASIEVGSVTPLCNLIDLSYREKITPDNQIYICIDEDAARIFVYQEEFLTGISYVDHPGGLKNDASFAGVIDSINQKIDMIRVESKKRFDIRLHHGLIDFVKVTENEELEYIKQEVTEDPDSEQMDNDRGMTLPSVVNEKLFQSSVLRSPQRINLFKSGLFLIKEAKKYLREIIVTGGIIAACLVLYFGSVGYMIIKDSSKFDELDRKYSIAIKKYLPPGTSKKNAATILRDKTKEIRLLKIKNKKFENRHYTVSLLFSNVSLIKKDVASFSVKKMIYSDKSLSLQGNVLNEKDFEMLKKKMDDYFSEDEYITKTTQKRLSNSEIEFSFSIRPKTG
ncbi:MAG: hypothetical protein OEY59_04160 [Deltaproteobacteria bacterium]|nr:hypothetical protein [Deltaproteobacteria bacterium]